MSVEARFMRHAKVCEECKSTGAACAVAVRIVIDEAEEELGSLPDNFREFMELMMPSVLETVRASILHYESCRACRSTSSPCPGLAAINRERAKAALAAQEAAMEKLMGIRVHRHDVN